ncbi:ParB/RepB/Spo0J family partition protein [Sphingomonas sp. AR_OL41]|jgi:ParB family chromosome partitioning protein|uniref:Putative plasmid stabilization protein n=1 Tax=hydrothermal vent metagenome TaxID=652676 RepID=A0A170PPN3_9ZZZZ|nr:ParB/RepB/Spo0J family partition protein [Sphingomonas sp. AR_OL41]MDH7970700.1 ParB/RepB/Spo0J family partition protein [Sphingomonas sp. AR_OL41]
MSQLPILVPASKLTKSPTNVRKSTDPVADAQLEANIAEKGIIQNLIGVPVARKKGQYRITAGGRRLDAVHRLIDKAVFDADYLVPVLPLADPKDAIEISLAENFFRLAMNPAEACRAFQDVIETEGKTPADVAKRFGVTEKFVHGRLRLAALAEPVFDALASNAITLDVAMAYAATSDTERQTAVFRQMGEGYHRSNVSEIRRQLASFSYRASDPRALLVGRDAYLAAGGRIDKDLFSDADSESWLDTQIVDALAEEALAAAAETIRERDGFQEVRAVAATHVPYTETYALQPLRGDLPPLAPEQETRQAEIKAELEEIASAREDEGYAPSVDDELRNDALEAELASITERTPVLTDTQKAEAVAYIVIGPDGSPRVHEQLYVALEPNTAEDQDDGAGRDPEADEAIVVANDAKPVISQRLADELAAMKTELIAIHVASDPVFALDLGTFIMVEAASRPMDSDDVPSELRAIRPTPRVQGFDSGTPAAAEWTKLDKALNRSWIGHETIQQRYDAFCALDDAERAAWLGWAIARTIDAVPSGRTGSDFLDHLGAKLAIDVATWWRPTARAYFDRITKPAILGLFEEVGGVELKQRYSASKKHDLAASAERLFAGDIIVEADVKARAVRWIPDGMRFSANPAAASTETVADETITDEPAVGSAPHEDAAPLADAA